MHIMFVSNISRYLIFPSLYPFFIPMPCLYETKENNLTLLSNPSLLFIFRLAAFISNAYTTTFIAQFLFFL